MKAFAALVRTLEDSASERTRQDALQHYLGTAPPADAAWAVALLAGARRKPLVPAAVLRRAAEAASALPAWLLDECHAAVGDVTETLALLVPEPEAPVELTLDEWMRSHLMPLKTIPRQDVPQALGRLWRNLPSDPRVVVFKLLAGRLRVGVPLAPMARVLGDIGGVDPRLVAQRLLPILRAEACPTPDDWRAWLAPGLQGPDVRPLPFPPVRRLQVDAGTDDPWAGLGDVQGWRAHWWREGPRVQLVRRGGVVAGWTADGELVTDLEPAVQHAAAALAADAVLDVQRLGDAQWGVFDLLETQGQDWRGRPWPERRARLASLLAASGPALRLADSLEAASWAGLKRLHGRAREHRALGLRLQRTEGPDASWLEWPLPPLHVRAVLLYAERPDGRSGRAGAEYTFGVWSGPADQADRRLLPLAKAHEGLPDAERERLDAHVRDHALERFGPVTSVAPSLVVELGFDAVVPSARRKSGVELRHPRILRRRDDLDAQDADDLGALAPWLPPGDGSR